MLLIFTYILIRAQNENTAAPRKYPTEKSRWQYPAPELRTWAERRRLLVNERGKNPKIGIAVYFDPFIGTFNIALRKR